MSLKRTPFQNGYEDALDRGYGASGMPLPKDLDEYVKGYQKGEAELTSRNPIDRLTRDNIALRARLEEAEQDLRVARGDIAVLRVDVLQAEAERDEQAEAVRKLTRVAAWMRVHMADPRIASLLIERDGRMMSLSEALSLDFADAMNNPIDDAAAKMIGGGE